MSEDDNDNQLVIIQKPIGSAMGNQLVPNTDAQDNQLVKAKLGAGSKKTPELVKRFISLISAGASKTAAARVCRISVQSWDNWVAQDGELALDYEQALGEFEARNVALIQKAANERIVKRRKTVTGKDGEVTVTEWEETIFDWQAALALLERKNPVEWSPKRQIIGTGGDINFTFEMGHAKKAPDNADD